MRLLPTYLVVLAVVLVFSGHSWAGYGSCARVCCVAAADGVFFRVAFQLVSSSGSQGLTIFSTTPPLCHLRNVRASYSFA